MAAGIGTDRVLGYGIAAGQTGRWLSHVLP
jgi:hypothetical protein